MKKIVALRLILVIMLQQLYSCTDSAKVDLIVRNATIYTVNASFDVTQAMAIKDGKTVGIGPEHEILNKYVSEQIIDAKKQAIYPGFIDAHCHFVGYAKGLQQIDLVGSVSFEEVIERVLSFTKKTDNKFLLTDTSTSIKWIVGWGWDQNDWENKAYPSKEKLDALFPETPVFLVRIDGHAALVNQKALDINNITKSTKIEGGIIELKNNQLTGILIDKAMEVVKHKIPKFSKEQLTEALLVAEQKLIAVGLTSVDDAELTRYEIELIDELQQQNKLQLNVYAMISATPELLDYYLKKGLYKTEKLNVRSFKFYADGALGSRGACLLHPYSDAPNEYGLLMNTPEFYHKYALLIAEKGFQMNTHCIGDSANRLILNVYKEVLKTTNDKRWRIEHAQVIHPDDFKKFSEINVIPSIQPTHATSDMYWAKDRLGEERTKNAYAYQQLLSENGIVALGTDFPIEDISPIKTFYAAVFRKDVKGFPKDGFQLENSLSREQALKGMTIWAAISNFEENEKGSLEVGKKADFIILDKDIMKISAEKMLKTNVIQTFIDGKLVFTM